MLRSRLTPAMCSPCWCMWAAGGKAGGQPGLAYVIVIAGLRANIDTRFLGRCAAPVLLGDHCHWCSPRCDGGGCGSHPKVLCVTAVGLLLCDVLQGWGSLLCLLCRSGMALHAWDACLSAFCTSGWALPPYIFYK